LKALLLFLLFPACSSFPPASVTAGFFGATIEVATPGWSAPVPTTPSAVITEPTLLVPANSVAADHATATVSATGRVIPVVVAPVAAPVLAVPSGKKAL
jgi:hypothetical protein